MRADFTAQRYGQPVDVERLEHHQRFDLVVDPERFAADRIPLRLTRPVVRPDG